MNSQPSGESAQVNLPQWVRELWDSGALKEPQGVHLLMTRLEGEGQTPEESLRSVVRWLSILVFMGNGGVQREQALRLWQETSYLCWRHNLSLSAILLDAPSYSLV